MALPTVAAAYEDCYDHYERARESERGIRIFFQKEKDARHFQFRMHQARSIERRESRQVYDKIDPRWNKSINDRYRVAVRQAAEGDGWWVYIEVWNQEIGTIEEL